MKRLSSNYRNLARIYLHLAYALDRTLDYSGAALLATYRCESFGGDIERLKEARNGYAYGKQWYDWQISNWEEGLAEGTLTIAELESDPSLLPGYKKAIRTLKAGRNRRLLDQVSKQRLLAQRLPT